MATTEDFRVALGAVLGVEHVSSSIAEREHHSRDQSSHPGRLPDLVAWPGNAQEVSALMQLAAQHRTPVTAWGAGSSLEGNPIPQRGGLVVDFGRMNRLLAVHTADFQAVVQPGLLYKDMNRQLARQGLFFAPDPGANASLGGMIANNAAGTRTPKYGATRDNVLALEVVLADGRVIRTGSRSVKQSAGYDLTHLFTGSEGTLGLVTEATIRLAPLPAYFSAATVAFPSLEAAAEAVSEMIGAGLGPAALEILDAATVEAMNGLEEFDFPLMPALFVEFHGASEEALSAELNMAQAICAEHGAGDFQSGMGREARAHLWAARHQLGEALPRLHAGLRYVGVDVAVPISAFPALAAEAAAALEDLPETYPYLFGHAGDGNLHSMIFVPGNEEQYEQVRAAFSDRVVAAALRLGGTCTGEHGVGVGKRRYMVAEHGAVAVQVMWAIKRALDPLNLLNPGKVLPEGVDEL